MAIQGDQPVTPEEFRLLAERAGLALTAAELKALRPLYEVYLETIRPLKSIDLKAEELGLEFRADWPTR